MNYITLIITVPLTIFVLLFAVANPAAVQVFDWPDDALFSTGLNILGLSLLGGGFLLGALFVWIHAQKLRVKLWQQTRRADRLEKELDKLQAKAEAVEKPASLLLTGKSS